MKNLLFANLLKHGMLDAYKKFTKEIIGRGKQEYKELLKCYGLRTAKVWHEKLSERDYVMIVHEAEDDALERLKNWASSTHPFDLWFCDHLNKCYEKFPEPSHYYSNLIPVIKKTRGIPGPCLVGGGENRTRLYTI
jgi:hypothetical protein